MDRRLAAILAADIVGYTRLMGADEAGTLARLKQLQHLLQPLIDSHRGRVVKHMGDGVLIEFASAVEAVACAWTWQQAVRDDQAAHDPASRILYRIGINLGDVIVDGDDIFGDGVNVAARLQQMAEPGEVVVSRQLRDQLGSNVEIDFDDLGELQLRNVAKPVGVLRLRPNDQTLSESVHAGRPRSRRRLIIAAAVGAVLLAFVGLGLWTLPRWLDNGVSETAEAGWAQPAIAVLPFENMSDDPEQRYFAKGIAEDLITDLSKLSGLLVIARTSSFAYKERGATVRAIAEGLNVSYVVEGSVRRTGDRYRITAQLIDTATGGHLWAERYDGPIAEMFDAQDRIREAILRELAVRLSPEEAARFAARGTGNIEAYEHFLRGMDLLAQQKTFAHDAVMAAQAAFQQAVALDPHYAQAHAGLGWCIYLQLQYLGRWDWGLQQTAALAERSIALQDNALAHRLLAKHHFRPPGYGQVTGDGFEDALRELNKARRLEPNNPDVLADLAQVLAHAGEPDEARRLMALAWRLNPSAPTWYRVSSGFAHLMATDFKPAIADFEVLQAQDPWSDAELWLAVARALDGQERRAQAVMQSWQQRSVVGGQPQNWTVATVKHKLRFKRDSDWQLFEEGLRRAGMPPAPTW